MNVDLSEMDPLTIFRCRNPNCRQIFTPSTIMSEDEHKVRFVCPICKSEYEAEYSEVTGIIPNQKVIMLVEEPKLTYLGTRIASS